MNEKIKIIALENLYLDPNNYRLRNHPKYSHISLKTITKPAVQKKTQNLITGKGNKEIRDLLESFRSNGFLRVDNVLVKRLEKNNFVVVEGNRRIAALKILNDEYSQGFSIGKLNPRIFKSVSDGGGIEVVEFNYHKDTEYLILMGLRHVSGNKKWDKYNQAKLVYELEKKTDTDMADIARKIGIPKSIAEQFLYGYYAIEEFIDNIKGESYFDEFDPYSKFMIFVELLNQNKLRDWVGWDAKSKTFKNKNNRDRFFSWITPKMEIGEDEEIETEEPIIISHKQVRELNSIIDNNQSIELMESERNFEKALSEDPDRAKSTFSSTIKEIEKKLKKIKLGTFLTIDAEDKKSLNNISSLVNSLLSDK
ncbi:MAG: hypothetical protein C0412_17605 [Flavobacterium sp.]|nr:hypothetical protein [Flavobacterium sp.]